MSIISSKETEWVNVLKFIGIVAVILGHIKSPFGSFIFSWHMPLFFVLSGFFIKTVYEPFQFFTKNFTRMMVPYFIFSLLALLSESIKRVLLHRPPLNFNEELSGVFIWMDMDALTNSYAFVLWFLPALFIARYGTYLILKYINIKIFQILIVLLLFLISFNIQLPFAIDNGLNAILFVYMGYYLYEQNKKVWPISIVILSLIYIFYGIPELNMSQKQYGEILLNVLWAVSISSLLMLLVTKIKTLKLIIIWGANTMLLFIFHPYTNNVASVFIEKMGYGGAWYLKLLLSLMLLQALLYIKSKRPYWIIFRYV